MSSDYVLLFVASATCGACEVFKKSWPTIKQYLSTIAGTRLSIEEIDLPKRSNADLDLKKYPPILVRYIQWFPTFILIERASLEKAKSHHTSDHLNIFVYNGQVPAENDKVVTLSGDAKAPNGPNLAAWIENILNNNNKTSQEETVNEPKTLLIDPMVCTRYKLKSKFK